MKTFEAVPKAAALAGAKGVEAALRHDYSKDIGWQGRLWGNDVKLKRAAVQAAQRRAMQKVYSRGIDLFFGWEQDLRRLIPELERTLKLGIATPAAQSAPKRPSRPLWPTPRR